MGRRITVTSLESRVRLKRVAAGLNQQELSQRSGLSRQTISAIEADQYIPNTAVALRLAQVLGCSVEDLFLLPTQSRRIAAELASDSASHSGTSGRVQVARVGQRVLAHSLTGAAGMRTAADGLVVEDGPGGATVEVDLLIDPQVLDQTAVVLGCDPALGLLGGHLTRRYPSLRLVLGECDSTAALQGLGRGEAHAAGTHLYDAATGAQNLPSIQRELAGRRLVVVTLSEWQQGLIVVRGNPKGINGPADLARADVSVVNRESGAGSRKLLDAWLSAAGVRPEQVRGYDREAPSHMAVAASIAWRTADVRCRRCLSWRSARRTGPRSKRSAATIVHAQARWWLSSSDGSPVIVRSPSSTWRLTAFWCTVWLNS
ncbi:MAG: helix-turn-helix domain-containing protein [Chloroflexi bacterium]|nr:helix-turn-helix domain-containing protein [Chloroflexota bacterium]